MTELQKRLFALQDEKYRDFNSKLVPGAGAAFIGVRTPLLRNLAKHYDEVLPYIAERRMDAWTHNKAIQKALESYRVSDEHKTQLRGLKIKEK